ncbi:leucine-rich repeat receptor protein kinase EMS1 [Setaria italica]|nr:leucine-rich repeat receptor protein kinase EMS1 [Setaria italica]
MKDLQYLDLASNNFSGTIPRSLVHLKAMSHMPADNDSLSNVVYYGWSLWGSRSGSMVFVQDGPFNFVLFSPDFSHIVMFYTDNLSVVTKGQQLEFTTGIRLMVNLDLPCNKLTGKIPEEISTLTALKSLNLSWNNLSGTIPTKVGNLQSLESLDLSYNELSGEIPTSISSMTALSHLNLSYNNLSGQIPSGYQLRTLDNQASIYIGNPGLCGPPLSKNCSEPKPPPDAMYEHKDASDALFLYLGLGVGSAMGLWAVYFSLLFNRKWRIACFLFSDRLYDQVYVKVALTWAFLTRALDRS